MKCPICETRTANVDAAVLLMWETITGSELRLSFFGGVVSTCGLHDDAAITQGAADYGRHAMPPGTAFTARLTWLPAGTSCEQADEVAHNLILRARATFSRPEQMLDNDACRAMVDKARNAAGLPAASYETA